MDACTCMRYTSRVFDSLFRSRRFEGTLGASGYTEEAVRLGPLGSARNLPSSAEPSALGNPG